MSYYSYIREPRPQERYGSRWSLTESSAGAREFRPRMAPLSRCLYLPHNWPRNADRALEFIGFGVNAPNLVSRLQSGMPPDMRARAAGGYTTAVFLGQLLATFVFAYLAKTTDFAGTFLTVALACFVVLVGAAVALGSPTSLLRSRAAFQSRALSRR